MSVFWGMMLMLGVTALTFKSGGNAALSSMLAGAAEAVSLTIELAGGYLLFLGLLGVLRRAGLMEKLSRGLDPVIRRLFPGAGASAGPIALALSANMLGLGNAATPLGLAAMRAMDAEAPARGVATRNMCTFVALNASALQLLPTGLIALRQASGSAAPARIVLPSLLASAAATLTAVILCRIRSK